MNKERDDVRESFNKNQFSLRPRNLIKTQFLALQGVDVDWGLVQALNVASSNTYIEKKVSYGMLGLLVPYEDPLAIMCTNRMSMDLESSNRMIIQAVLDAYSSLVC